MRLKVQERPELETTMTEYHQDTVAFTHRQYAVYIVGGDLAARLRAYWHMCSSDNEFWSMTRIKKTNE